MTVVVHAEEQMGTMNPLLGKLTEDIVGRSPAFRQDGVINRPPADHAGTRVRRTVAASPSDVDRAINDNHCSPVVAVLPTKPRSGG